MRRWLKRLAVVLLAYVLLSFAGAWVFTHPPAGSHPREVAEPFGPRFPANTVRLPPATPGEPELGAWYRPARPGADGTVVLLHGYRESRAQMAGLARRLAESTPHALLVPDFRGCGESEDRPETAGITEVEDVRTALGFLRREGRSLQRTVLVGFSMGGVAALRATARPETDPVAGLLLISPYDSLETAIDVRTRHYSLIPARPLFTPLIWFGELLAGVDLDSVDLLAEAGRVRAQFRFVISEDADWRAPLEGAQALAAALRAPLRTYKGEDHLVLWSEHRDSVELRCLQFIQQALR